MLSCPTPRKHRFHRRIDAMMALASTYRARSSYREECRIYWCVCGGWHLTSKPKRRRKPA